MQYLSDTHSSYTKYASSIVQQSTASLLTRSCTPEPSAWPTVRGLSLSSLIKSKESKYYWFPKINSVLKANVKKHAHTNTDAHMHTLMAYVVHNVM